MAKRKKRTEDHDPRWMSKLRPAPGELRMVQAFVNTVDLEQGTDLLTSEPQLIGWMELWGLAPPGTRLAGSDLERAVAARESLRTMIAVHSGAKANGAAVTRIDQLAHSATLRIRFDADGRIRFEAVADGLDGALARICGAVAAAQFEGIWQHLKICRRKTCRAAYFSRSRASKWCSPQCGSRLSSRVYRKRNLQRLREEERQMAWMRRQAGL